MMISFIKKIHFSLIHEDTTILCTLICIMHIFLSIVSFYHGYDPLTRYHLYAVIVYIVLLTLSKTIPQLYLFLISYLETMAYSLLITFKYGNDCGAYILTLSLLAYLFMLVITSNTLKIRLFLPSFLTISTIVVLQFFDIKLASTIFNITNSFYILHYTTMATTSILTILFISYVVQTNYLRTRAKTAQKTEYLNYSATHDALTKVLNRRQATHIINEFTTKPEYSSTTFSVAIFDIDFFKKINDTYGHDCGDVVLRNVAELIQRCLPDHTTFARWGGEEFLIIFEGTYHNPAEVLEDIRSRVQDHSFVYAENGIKVTITIGLSQPERSYNFSKILIAADKNLMKGKKQGRNQIVTEVAENENK